MFYRNAYFFMEMSFYTNICLTKCDITTEIQIIPSLGICQLKLELKVTQKITDANWN